MFRTAASAVSTSAKAPSTSAKPVLSIRKTLLSTTDSRASKTGHLEGPDVTNRSRLFCRFLDTVALLRAVTPGDPARSRPCIYFCVVRHPRGVNPSGGRSVARPGFDPEQLSSGDNGVAVVAVRQRRTDRIRQIRRHSPLTDPAAWPSALTTSAARPQHRDQYCRSSRTSTQP